MKGLEGKGEGSRKEEWGGEEGGGVRREEQRAEGRCKERKCLGVIRAPSPSLLLLP